MKAQRVIIAGLLTIGGLIGSAGPASATCHPEKPSTCEADFPPDLPQACWATITLPTGDQVTPPCVP